MSNQYRSYNRAAAPQRGYVRQGRPNVSVRTPQAYVSGSAARQVSVRTQRQMIAAEQERIREQELVAAAARRNRERAARMNPALITFMAVILFLTSFILIRYISLQSRVTESVKEISALEKTYASLKESNDEMENEINARINLDDIKFKAITELGMTYADQNQIITYAGETGDYVQQVREIGN
ncbi:MAG: cell division protein FtsL [Lachnospiraceae bacterium]|nr:cell division protein FtsL [Lachnospiraceae bacterium]